MQAVVEAADGAGVQLALIDARRLSQSPFLATADAVSIPDREGVLIDVSGGRGWLRRLAPEDWRDGVDPASVQGVVRNAWISAVMTICELGRIEWLSSLDRIYGAEDKLVQQRACRQLGLSAPAMVLTTDPTAIPKELGRELVVKPLAAGHFRDERGHAHVVHATPMRRDDERLALLAGAPFLVQRRVPASLHIRAVTVRDQAWLSQIPAGEFPLDWRQAEAAHTSWQPATHDQIARGAVALAEHMQVGYSSQDWIVDTRGAAHFLDLNPAGQWLFLPAETSDAVTAAIAGWLVDNT